MGILEVFILAIGVSMDACAVAVCKGLALQKISWRHVIWISLWFGVFQAIMPLIGYFLGVQFKEYITTIDHWIAFALLLFLGIKMIKEAWTHKEELPDACLAPKHMLLLAIATSIDALALGITFAFLRVQIIPAVCLIGCTTFVVSAFGVKFGSILGEKFQSKAEFLGGVILILLGCKILLDHLGILP